MSLRSEISAHPGEVEPHAWAGKCEQDVISRRVVFRDSLPEATSNVVVE